MWPYFEEILILNSYSLGFFNKESQWSSQNRDKCPHSYITLLEITDNNEYIRKRNGDGRYLKFTLG